MSNSIGQIYGKIKNGKSCIKLESEIVDINGIEINSDGSSLVPMSKGMVVQVQHKDYKKTVTKSGTGWSAIDNNLETGFVVAIKPSSSASNVLVSCNLQIGMHASQDARYWGARLYRKIGNGDWTRVTEAENNDSVAGQTPQPTPVWLSDGMGVVQSNDDNFQISNLGNSFLDSPNTTETVYYTIYWKCKLGQPDGDANVVLHLNRAYSMLNTYSALPISNITAKEIWNSGSIYTPPTTLITTDEINNVVNVTSNLTVANNKVMTVPSLDICGNDLSANTTYEITTGPPGSINNISFVKKREPYYLSANLTTSQNLSTTTTDVAGWTVLAASDASDFNATTGIWTCPSTGVYTVNYELLVEGGFQILRIEAYIVVVGSSGSNFVREARVAVEGGQADDFKFMPLKVSAMRELTAGMQVKVMMNATVAASYVWHRINGNYATHMWIQRVD